MATIKIHLLESRVATATYNDVSIESPNNYRIIAGEENATQFEIVYDQNVWNGYNFSVEMVNSKGYNVVPPTIENNTFTLPDGMATAGYGYIGIKATKGSEVVPFMPVKVKVWNYIEAWKGNVIDKNITVQDFVELENRVEYLEQNGTGGGGSTPANAVTTDTAQTITGKKTFTKPVFIKNASYEDPLGTDGLEITPHSLVHYDTYVPDEDGFMAELNFPSTGGVLATEEYVQEYVAENTGGGSSADVGEIQICCATNFLLGSTQSGKVSIVLSNNTIIGTPIVGGYVLCKNGLAIIDEINDITMIVTPITMYGIQLNGKLAYNSNFYAPTTAGTSGYVLTSSGQSGEPPVWKSPDTLGGSSGNQYTFTVTDSANVSTKFVFTLFGNLTFEDTSGTWNDRTLLIHTLNHNVGYNKIVPASGVWAGSEYVWGIKQVDYYTAKIYTVGGVYDLPMTAQFTYYTQPLNKLFTIAE